MNNYKYKVFRPIHYLGSKLRILDFIKNTIDDIDPSNGTVCDLFSGSGTVSKYLSLTRQIISVDIQEYSRILCSALLKPFTKIDINCYNNLNSNSHFKQLYWTFKPIIVYENIILNEARKGNILPICDFLKNGSLITYLFNKEKSITTELRQALNETYKRLLESNLLDSNETLITRYYGGLYFSYYQAIVIDTLLELQSEVNTESKDVLLAAVLSTASDIVNTIGKQFAQPLNPIDNKGNPKKRLINKIYNDRTLDTNNIFTNWLNKYNNQIVSIKENIIYKMDYSEALDIIKNVKVVYADPPYTRYHYSRYYHVLETMCLRDNPKISSSNIKGKYAISRGIYRNDRYQSIFGIKSKSNDAFNILFNKVSKLNSSLVLSYSPYNSNSNVTPRIQTVENLIDLANKYFSDVRVSSFGKFTHSKLNKSELHIDASNNAELLIVCNN